MRDNCFVTKPPTEKYGPAFTSDDLAGGSPDIEGANKKFELPDDWAFEAASAIWLDLRTPVSEPSLIFDTPPDILSPQSHRLLFFRLLTGLLAEVLPESGFNAVLTDGLATTEESGVAT